MGHTLLLLVRMYVRTQLEYRASFLLDRVAQILEYGAVFASLWVLLNQFQTLGGWTWPQMAMLLSFQLLAYAIGAAVSYVQFRNVEKLVRLGTFDTLLVKPISPWAYLVCSGINVSYVGHIILAVALMIWALGVVEVHWSVQQVLFLVAALISAATMTAAVLTMIGASALILVQSSYFYSIFFGVWGLTRYPLSIFPPALQWMMFTIVPLGFLAYVPVAVFLGKDVPLLEAWAGPLSLLSGPIAVGLAIVHWRWCIRGYQSGGG